MGKAEKKFKRNDFNMLYDYLWRDKNLAESTTIPGSALYGKNKEIRMRALERVTTINHIINIMEIIERDNLTFKDGDIFRDGIFIR